MAAAAAVEIEARAKAVAHAFGFGKVILSDLEERGLARRETRKWTASAGSTTADAGITRAERYGCRSGICRLAGRYSR